MLWRSSDGFFTDHVDDVIDGDEPVEQRAIAGHHGSGHEVAAFEQLRRLRAPAFHAGSRRDRASNSSPERAISTNPSRSTSRSVSSRTAAGANPARRTDEVIDKIGGRGVQTRMAKMAINSSASGKVFTLYLGAMKGIKRRDLSKHTPAGSGRHALRPRRAGCERVVGTAQGEWHAPCALWG